MPNPLRILLVTSWGQPQCGIQAHSELLIESVEAADGNIEVQPSSDALNPDHDEIRSLIHDAAVSGIDIVHLNYHRALCSRWTPDKVRRLKESYKVVITFHDTFGESAPDQLSRDLHDLADAFIVHEPCEELPKAIYWRQGVPELDGTHGAWPQGYYARPFVGSVGFDFGWKNYDRLCEIAAAVGWGVLLYVPEMTPEREADLRQRNPWLTVRRNRPLGEVLAGLHLCAATAFLYVNGNSGTSAAIRLGIAARQPVIALRGQRQFRDLAEETALVWVDTFEEVQQVLPILPCGSWDAGIVELAERGSWRRLGQRYADLYRQLGAARPPAQERDTR